MPAPKGHAPYNVNGEGGVAKIYTKEFIEKEADAFEEWLEQPNSVFFKSFAMSRGYKPSFLSEWANINDRFKSVYDKAKEWQECKLFDYSFFNKGNVQMGKFALINHHGWRDKQETVILSADSQNPLAALLTQTDGKSKEIVDDKSKSS